MEKNPDNNPPKKVDPGWNDPPMLNYSATNPPPKSRITNKRVAFPMETTSNFLQSSSKIPPSGSAPPKPPEGKNDGTDNKDMYEEVSNNINKILAKFPQRPVIVEKIDLMKLMWAADKFPSEMKDKISQLLNCVIANDYLNAKEIESNLMLHHPDLCSSWMIGMKSLINTCRDV